MKDRVWALAIHGGAGPAQNSDYQNVVDAMRKVLSFGQKALENGASATEVVCDVVQMLEDSGDHVAGRGASPNADGKWELDAAIMDGEKRKAGAVAALRDYKSPVKCAQKVMEESSEVLLSGKGAAKFLKPFSLDKVRNPNIYYRPVFKGHKSTTDVDHGTVGAVALDAAGRLASATSSGGTKNVLPGRVSGSPLLGAGTWADERVAVSCTGQGEYFIRSNTAADISARIHYKRSDLKTAAADALEQVSLLGGQGGLIAIDCLGRISMPFNTKIMKRGKASFRGEFEVKVF